jgi:hypothetical protein
MALIYTMRAIDFTLKTVVPTTLWMRFRATRTWTVDLAMALTLISELRTLQCYAQPLQFRYLKKSIRHLNTK